MLPYEHGCIWEDHPVILLSGTIGGRVARPRSPETRVRDRYDFVDPSHRRRYPVPGDGPTGPTRVTWAKLRRATGPTGLGVVEHVGHHHHRLRNSRRTFPNLLDRRWDGCNVSRTPIYEIQMVGPITFVFFGPIGTSIVTIHQRMLSSRRPLQTSRVSE